MQHATAMHDVGTIYSIGLLHLQVTTRAELLAACGGRVMEVG